MSESTINGRVETSPRSGRRPGNPDTRSTIMAAARQAFSEYGFAGTSIRTIAAQANVDPALVHHYFGSKSELFQAAIRSRTDMTETIRAFAEARPRFGERMVELMLEMWEGQTVHPVAALLRAALSDRETAEQNQDQLSYEMVGSALRDMGVPEPEIAVRSSIVGTVILGLVAARYLLIGTVAKQMPRAVAIRAYGDIIQRTVDVPFHELTGSDPASA